MHLAFSVKESRVSDGQQTDNVTVIEVLEVCKTQLASAFLSIFRRAR